MVFSLLVFIFVFLPIVFGLSRIIPDKKGMTGRNAMLLAASLLFYAFGDPAALGIMILSVIFNYICGRLMNRHFKEAVHAVCCAVNIGLLFVFKYLSYIMGLAGLSLPHIVLLLGISFFTFQALSYVIDCYRDPSAAFGNILKLELYISFFPSSLQDRW